MHTPEMEPVLFPPAELDAELRGRLQRFPNELKALLVSELKLGNRIIEVGAGHPAAPIGEPAMLAEDLHATDPALLNGLSIHARNSSLFHQEVTDSTRHFFIVTAPWPPPELPDMNALRVKHRGPNGIVVPPAHLPAERRMEVDDRGEMLIYNEADRRADIMCTWSQGSRSPGSTLSAWYPMERLAKPLSVEAQAPVLERLLSFIGRELGPTELEDRPEHH